MSFEIPGHKLGVLTADADFSAKQYYGVKVTSTGLAIAGAGDAIIGVLQDHPKSGQVAEVMVNGCSRALAGGTIAKGDLIACGASGTFVVATKGKTDTSDAGAASDPLIGSNVVGIALTGAASGEYFALEILHLGAVPTTNA